MSFPPGLYTEYCVGGDVFVTVYAWNTKTYGDASPQNCADFFDVEKLLGKRAYRNKVAGVLEPAMMALGVTPMNVYAELNAEEGIKRALDEIRELKPRISVFCILYSGPRRKSY